MKHISILFVFSLFVISGLTTSCSAAPSAGKSDGTTRVDSLELLTRYSLFSEYHKNRDYNSAIKFGWEVLELDPKRFNRWIYDRMEDSYWKLYDSSDVSVEDKEIIKDTVLVLYDYAIENFPERAGYYQARKAFVIETWHQRSPEEVIVEYQKALEMDSTLSPYYYDRLGQIYKNLGEENEEYKEKALDLYSYLTEVEPDNQRWLTEIENLVDNIDQLLDINKRSWDLDKDNLAKAWKYASMAMRANEFERALEPLLFLTDKAPSTINYWNQLAIVYNRLDKGDDAMNVYRKLIDLEPDKREHYLNLGIFYKDKGQLSQARTQFLKASEVGGTWGLAVYYEGLLYEQSARSCGFEFEDRLVYLLAVQTYQRAYSIDNSLTQARERINALATSIPSKEDYFFRNVKSGQVMQLTGSCYGWIQRSVTIP